MPYATTDMTQILGIGAYVGEIQEGPDGQLYEWVEGVDGLGNPIGFWKKIKKFAGGLVKKALPMVMPMVQKAFPFVKQALPFIKQLAPFAKFLPIPGLAPALEIAQKTGILGLGEVIEGSDGQLYEVVEGIGSLGERRRYLRKVWLSIPATIRPRGVRMRRPVPAGMQRRPIARPMRWVQMPYPVAPGMQQRPVAPISPTAATTAAQFRRFR